MCVFYRPRNDGVQSLVILTYKVKTDEIPLIIFARRTKDSHSTLPCMYVMLLNIIILSIIPARSYVNTGFFVVI